jgi:site-specific DNA-methyltransferase (adenine-specific)
VNTAMGINPYYQDAYVTIYHGDCRDILPQLEPVDLVLTDPPYGIKIDSWDSPIELKTVNLIIRDHTKSFLAFFGQMPSIGNWHNSMMDVGFKFLEHIIWVKRSIIPNKRLSRSHESIYIYSLGKSDFNITKGRFEDVKLPGVLVDTNTLEGIDRYIKDLLSKLSGKSGKIKRGKKGQKAYKRFENYETDRSPEFVNLTNVWSFLSPNLSKRDGIYLHPTEKPIEIMKRLIEMLSQRSDIVLDPFMGSGTTLRAAKDLGRRAIGIEIEEKYCEIAAKRMAKGE